MSAKPSDYIVMVEKYIAEERILQLKGKKHRNLKVNSGDKDSSPFVGKVRERVEKAAQWTISEQSSRFICCMPYF